MASLLHKFIDVFRDMPTRDSDPNAYYRCCELCRPKTLQAFKVLEEVLLPYAEDLERVDTHRFGDTAVETSQINDISPHKHSLVRKHVCVYRRLFGGRILVVLEFKIAEHLPLTIGTWRDF
jgi:hypothetical protein